MNVQIDTTDQMFNNNPRNTFNNSYNGYSNRANQQKISSLQSVDGLLKSARHNSSMKERNYGGQFMKSPARKSIPMLNNENINPLGVRDTSNSPFNKAQLEGKRSSRRNCNQGNQESPISHRFNFDKSVEDHGKISANRQVLKDQKNDNNWVGQQAEKSPLELAQRALQKRISNSNNNLQKQPQEQSQQQQEKAALQQQPQQSNFGYVYGYAFGQYYLLNMHRIVQIQKFFRKRKQQLSQQRKQQLSSQSLSLKIKNIRCISRDQEQSVGNESARNVIPISQRELTDQNENSRNSEQIQELKAENNQLKKTIYQLKLDMKSQLESALLQQKSEMKDISDQYSSFLDKVVQDKKDLANRCLSLSRENTELVNENNKLKAEVEEIKRKGGIQERQHSEEVEGLRRQLDELVEKVKIATDEGNQLKESNRSLIEMNTLLKQEMQIEKEKQHEEDRISKKDADHSKEVQETNNTAHANGYDTQKMQELQILFVEIDEERQKAWEMVSKMKKAYEDLRTRCNEEKQQERAELSKFQALMRQTIQTKDESIAQLNQVIHNLRITFMSSNQITQQASHLDHATE